MFKEKQATFKNRFSSIIYAIIMIVALAVGYNAYNDLDKSLSDVITVNTVLESEVDTLRTENADLTQELRDAIDTIGEYNKLIDQNSIDFEDVRTLVNSFNTTIENLNSAAISAEENHSIVTADLEELNGLWEVFMDEYETRIGDVDDSLSAKSDSISAIQDDLDAIYALIEGITDELTNHLTGEYSELEANVSNLQTELTLLNTKIDEAISRIDKLENPLTVDSFSLIADGAYLSIVLSNNSYTDVENVEDFFNLMVYSDEMDSPLVIELEPSSISAGQSITVVIKSPTDLIGHPVGYVEVVRKE